MLITSSQLPHSLLPYITLLVFHSGLKTHVFHKLFPTEAFWFHSDAFTDLGPKPDLVGTTGIGLFQYVLFCIFLFLVMCASLS